MCRSLARSYMFSVSKSLQSITILSSHSFSRALPHALLLLLSPFLSPHLPHTHMYTRIRTHTYPFVKVCGTPSIRAHRCHVWLHDGRHRGVVAGQRGADVRLPVLLALPLLGPGGVLATDLPRGDGGAPRPHQRVFYVIGSPCL